MSSLGEKLGSETTNKLISQYAPIAGGVISRYGAAQAAQPQQTLPSTPSAALGGTTTDTTQQGGMTADSVKQAMLYDMAVNGGKNISAIKQIADMNGISTDGTTLTKDQQTQSTNITQALSALDSATQNLVTAGGAKGPIGGALTEVPLLGQYTNNAGTAYQQTKITIATALAKALTGTARVPTQLVQSYMNALPSVSDAPQQAQAKLDDMYSLLLTKAKNNGLTDIVKQYSQ
jgi:hypothetical protein